MHCVVIILSDEWIEIFQFLLLNRFMLYVHHLSAVSVQSHALSGYQSVQSIYP